MKIFVNAVLVLLSVVLQLLLLTSLWGWFVVPLGVSTIGYAQAFGLNLLITYFQVRNPKPFIKDLFIERSYRQKLGTNICLMITGLLLGYIAQLFM